MKGAVGFLPISPLGAFWGQFLRRYPDEAARSRQLSENCRWRTIPRGIVIGQEVQDRSIRVFVRGRGGVSIAMVVRLLASHREALEAQLGAALTIEDGCIIAIKSFAFETLDAANWDAMADWLRSQSDNYEGALRAAIESGIPEGERKRRRAAWRRQSSDAAANVLDLT